MLLIKTLLKNSLIHGIGLFANQFIPAGTKVWELTKGFDLILTQEQVSALPELNKEFIHHFAYQDKETLNYVLCSDDARFFNHADIPNVEAMIYNDGTYIADIANSDINIGDELTVDYRDFDTDPTYGFDKE